MPKSHAQDGGEIEMRDAFQALAPAQGLPSNAVNPSKGEYSRGPEFWSPAWRLSSA